MPDVKLKQWNGEEKVFPGAETITVPTKSGGSEVFTHGELAEDITADANFANGNMVLSPGNGKMVKNVTVNKPATLIPENIADGVDIAGIVGTLAAGGGNVKCETVTVNYTDVKTGITTMHHNLGVVPDIIVMKRLGNNIKGCINYAIGFSRAFADLTGIDPVSYAEYRSTSNQTTPVILAGYNSSGACFDESAARVGFHSVTSTEFSIGSTVIGLSNSFDHTFYLIGGLT